MTPQDWTVLITSMTAAAMTIFTAWTVWSDRRNKAERDHELAKLNAEKEAKAEAHRQHMEELAMVQVRQGSVTIKEAKRAAIEAVKTKEEVTQKIEKSREERATQIEQVASLIDANNKLNSEALDAANGTNEKIKSLGEEIAARSTTPPPA